MQAGDVAVGNHDGAFLWQAGGEQGAGARQQVIADDHVVAGAGQHHVQAAGGFPVEQSVHDTGGRVIRRFVTAIDDEVGLGVNRVTLLHQVAQRFLTVAAGQQGAVVARRHAADQGLQGAAQPD